MSGPVFVVDAGGVPLMPMSAAYARKLLSEGKATRLAHSAFTVIQLSRHLEQPTLRPIIVALRLHLRTAELFLVAEGQQAAQTLLHIIIDLRTDLPRRLRRRAGHRRRRRSRQRYHALARHGRPFKLRRPSLARSAWGTALLQLRPRRARPTQKATSGTPLLRWRAQAITRTLNVLRRLLPLTHILLLDRLDSAHHEHRPLTPARRREQLMRAYNFRNTQGRVAPVCAFCRTTEAPIEVDHLLPTSRGGTDAWENLALACQVCNQRKGSQTPEEAVMPLLLHHNLRSRRSGRLRPYIDGTLRALRGHLRELNLIAIRPGFTEGNRLAQSVMNTILAQTSDDTPFPVPIIAYPVPRPRKQCFTSRNYPLNTPQRADLVRVGRAIKRLVRVNQSLQLDRTNGKPTVQAIPMRENQTFERTPNSLLLRPGMLCSAARAGSPVCGVVSAIHSSGRLTLRVPFGASPSGVTWRPVVISPRRDLRVLSTDRVVFVRPQHIQPE